MDERHAVAVWRSLLPVVAALSLTACHGLGDHRYSRWR